MLYGGHVGHNNLILKLHTYFCLFSIYDSVCLFEVQIIGLSSLESPLPFWIPSLTPSFASPNHTCLRPPSSTTVWPRETREDSEIFDDSEEENRISARRTRANRDKATQKDRSSSSFCCGVIVGVLVVVSLLVCLIVNDKSKGEKVPRQSQRQTGKTCMGPFKAPRPVAREKETNSDVQVVIQEKVGEKDSQVQLITETKNLREIEARRLAIPPLVNPYPRGIKLIVIQLQKSVSQFSMFSKVTLRTCASDAQNLHQAPPLSLMNW